MIKTPGRKILFAVSLLALISLIPMVFSRIYSPVDCSQTTGYCYKDGMDGTTVTAILSNNPRQRNYVMVQPQGMLEPVLENEKTYLEKGGLKVLQGTDFVLENQTVGDYDKWLFGFPASAPGLVTGEYTFYAKFKRTDTGTELPEGYEFTDVIDLDPPSITPVSGYSGYTFNEDGDQAGTIEIGENVTIRAKIDDVEKPFDVADTIVESVEVTISSVSYPLENIGNDIYEVVIPDLDLGTYTAEFIAKDTLFNTNDLIRLTFEVTCIDQDNDGAYPETEGCTPIDCDDNDPERYPGAVDYCADGIDQDCDFSDECDCRDYDGDNFEGYDAITCSYGKDCNDNDKDISPAEPDICGNSIDEDCSGTPAVCSDCSPFFDNDHDNSCSDEDCDDSDPRFHPGAFELCNADADYNCDGEYGICDCGNKGLPDDDGDGYCEGDIIYPDCNDGDSLIYPGADERCNGMDDDCNGLVPSIEKDNDRDGIVRCAGDCNDDDPDKFPGNAEVCDGKDNDCNGQVDEGVSNICTNYDTCIEYEKCGPCLPAPAEICDGKDNDCNGQIDEDVLNVCTDYDDCFTYMTCSPCPEERLEVCNYLDDNCNGQVDEGVSNICTDYSDCSIYTSCDPCPLMPAEICDGIDNNCDGQYLQGEVDMDGDGVYLCQDDCDDTDPLMYPGAVEICWDNIDNDCIGGDGQCGCEDNDGDGYHGYDPSLCWYGHDCDDTNQDIHPGAPEKCTDGIDQDCNGLDLTCPPCFINEDQDAYCADDPADPDYDCEDRLNGEDGIAGNKDDGININPGAKELCGDGIDQDCDGEDLECTCPQKGLQDNDLDNYCLGDSSDIDCNDNNPDINPGEDELCNGFDDNCDAVLHPGEGDQDKDGFISCRSPPYNDCNDLDMDINPEAEEVCDGIDNDCDGEIDEYLLETCMDYGYCEEYQSCTVCPSEPLEICDGIDNDCDGEIDEGVLNSCTNYATCTSYESCLPCSPMPIEVCDGLDNDCDGQYLMDEVDMDDDGVYLCQGDCNDNNPDIYPGAQEICQDGIDNDCLGGDSRCDCNDYDGDGFNGFDRGTCPQGHDCDDKPYGADGTAGNEDDGANIYPGAPEVCMDGLDNDCMDGDLTCPLCQYDADSDAYCADDPADPDYDCEDRPDGADGIAGNKDDGKYINPGAQEICGDGIDQDCDGEDPKCTCFDRGLQDNDLDNYCLDDPIFSEADCDDTNPYINPDAEELCNGFDDNCDSVLFSGEEDGDIDSFLLCSPYPYTDCDDSNYEVNPGMSELCDGLDNDCDTILPQDEQDTDEDTFLDCEDCYPESPLSYPGAPESCNGLDDNCDGILPSEESDLDSDGISACMGDCNDQDPNIHPGAPELCNGIDDDCNPLTLEDVDSDLDGLSSCDGDCDNADPKTHPGAAEICDGKDNDCDGILPSEEQDADEDGFAVCEGDCNDDDPGIYPGAADICYDGIDQDCSGLDAECICYDGDGDSYPLKDEVLCWYGDDCNDQDRNIYPGAPERCTDNIDQDCDGKDAVCPQCYTNDDQDMYCKDNPASPDYDCDDNNYLINPGAPEVCGNAIDENCDGLAPVCTCWDRGLEDLDNDGYCADDPIGYESDCEDRPDGADGIAGTQDDGKNIHPGVTEVCNNAIDEDCRGGAWICEDNNPCTDNICGAGESCSYVPVIEGMGCDDGLFCTEVDVCMEGVCNGPPKPSPGAGIWKVGVYGNELEMTENTGYWNGEAISDITYKIGKNDLNILADGSIMTEKGVAGYSQYIYFEQAPVKSGYVKFIENDNDVASDFLYFPGGVQIARYSMEFKASLQSDVEDSSGIKTSTGTYLGDLEDETITLLGRDYSIVRARRTSSSGSSTELTLMGDAVKDTLSEGGSKTYTLEGKDYKVTVTAITDTGTIYAKFNVNGESTPSLKEGDSVTLSDKTHLGISEIIPNEAGDITQDIVEFYLGASKVFLKDAELQDSVSSHSLEYDDELIEGANILLKGSYDSSTFNLDSIGIIIKADDDYYVEPGHSLTDYMDEPQAFLDSWDISYWGLDSIITEEISIKAREPEQYNLDFIDGDGETVTAPLVYTSGGSSLKSGDNNDNLVLKGSIRMQKGDYFVVSDTSNSPGNRKTYALRYRGADKIGSEQTGTLKFDNIGKGERVEIEFSDKPGETPDATLQLGGAAFGVINASSAQYDDFDIWVDLDADGIIKEDNDIIPIETNAGMNIELDYETSNEYMFIVFSTPNEDDYDNIAPTPVKIGVFAHNGEVEFEDTGYSDIAWVSPSSEQNFNYAYTSMGAEFKWYNPMDSSDLLRISYPAKQKVPLVYVTGKDYEATNRRSCDDGRACTIDSCNEDIGSCIYDTAGCECSTDAECDDGNVCTDNTCSPEGYCNAPINNNAPCSDNDKCTENDQCSGGICSGAPKDCDDTDFCTDDSCNQYTEVCTHSPICQCDNDYMCIDENICTDDYCLAGSCIHINNDGPCDDNSLCTENDQCNDGQCFGSQITCDDNMQCSIDSCDPDIGCTHNKISCECSTDAECDDGNVCTDNTCSPEGYCNAPIKNNAPCSDNDKCTENDQCNAGSCSGTPKGCDDSDECTIDECSSDTGICTHEYICPCQSDSDCEDDGNICTGEVCIAGHCSTQYNTLNCNDGDYCTVNDICDGEGGCSGTPRPCDDGRACTIDSCAEDIGRCIYDTSSCKCKFDQDCNDFNPCTDNTCDKTTGTCNAHINNKILCDDQLYCTQDDTCNEGYCYGTPVDCNDLIGCTEDSCSEESKGCVYEYKCSCSTDQECDDDNPCTEESCIGNACHYDRLPDWDMDMQCDEIDPDDDADNIGDKDDLEVKTPLGCIVDQNTGIRIDSDNDNICDGLDKCEGTLPGCPVSQDGCPAACDEEVTLSPLCVGDPYCDCPVCSACNSVYGYRCSVSECSACGTCYLDIVPGQRDRCKDCSTIISSGQPCEQYDFQENCITNPCLPDHECEWIDGSCHTKDIYPPEAPVIGELPDRVIEEYITLTVTAEPGSKVTVYLNGQLADYSPADEITGTCTFENFIIVPGINNITAKAEDLAGNIGPMSDITEVLYISEGPSLLNIDPADGDKLNRVDRIDASFELYLNTPLSAASTMQLKDEGGDIVTGNLETNSYDTLAFVPSQQLEDGIYFVDILAEDILGNMRAHSISFTVSSNAPIITLEFPQKGAVLTTRSMEFRGIIESKISAINITSKKIFFDNTGYDLDLGQGSFSLAIEAEEDGIYEFNISAQNELGFVALEKGQLTIDTTGPGGCITIGGVTHCTDVEGVQQASLAGAVCGDGICDYRESCIDDCIIGGISGYSVIGRFTLSKDLFDAMAGSSEHSPSITHSAYYFKDGLYFPLRIYLFGSEGKAGAALSEIIGSKFLELTAISSDNVYLASGGIFWLSSNKIIWIESYYDLKDYTGLASPYLEKYPSTII